MNKKLTLEEIEDYAFYQSGLSEHGCLDKSDSYDSTSIKKYGRILLEKQIELYDKQNQNYRPFRR